MSSLKLETLAVGDKVGYLGSCDRDNYCGKEVEVTRITKTRVMVTHKLHDGRDIEHAFMIESGREVGTSSSWRSARLISLESLNSAKARRNAECVFSKQTNELKELATELARYDRIAITAGVKAKMLELINAMPVAPESNE